VILTNCPGLRKAQGLIRNRERLLFKDFGSLSSSSETEIESKMTNLKMKYLTTMVVLVKHSV